MRHEITVGEGEQARRIAVETREGSGAPVVWFGGFRSDMSGTKADALDTWAAEADRAFVRFDYSGHGVSGGRFEDGTISRWLEESLAVLDRFAAARPVIVGSSMGGWLALLAARVLRAGGKTERAASALVLIAPAADFTEALMWDAFPTEARREMEETGFYMRPSLYSDDPYPITRALIEDGRKHLLLGGTIETGCPIHILQGMQDPDVPWQHAMRLVEHLPADSVQITLIKDGDHRLSRPGDIARMVAAVAAAGEPPRLPAPSGEPQLRLTV